MNVQSFAFIKFDQVHWENSNKSIFNIKMFISFPENKRQLKIVAYADSYGYDI